MKLIMTALFFLSTYALATVDGHSRAYIVVQDIQSEEFFIERVPVIGCYGLSYGPKLVQFTAPYKASSNIGCGGEQFFDDINYLVCAKVTSTVESKDYSTITHMTLDISGCEEKNNPQLITMIRTAAKLNFPQAKGEIKLTIVK
ncbi:MAG: hypothetical protein JNL11_13390 [Bdellovibrionaceae bacterium]|nr:hypothetical protein [Pseudobdellovibrionaceae bacterium]